MRAPLTSIAVVVWLSAIAGSAQDPGHAGPTVGEPAGDFALVDQTGRLVTLASLMRAKGAMVVFHRSADW